MIYQRLNQKLINIEFSTKKHSWNGSKKIFEIQTFLFRSEYEHPLVIGNVKRKARTLGVEIKTVNDWEQFMEDEHV